MPKLDKSLGTTPSERYLARLCQSTFLSLWSYPNVFRKQGNGKELCDVLVVCGDDIIIFSDKSCEFGESGDIRTDWSRWYRIAIKKSADQLHGAERWIAQHPDRLFLEQACKTPFPLDLVQSRSRRFHLVAVALGAKARCQQALGGSGSLVLCPDVIGEDHCAKDCRPFFVGEINPNKTFVHIFDDVTLDAILCELDTITDLIAYLRCKEEFVRSGKLALAAGEENLLACYLADIGESGTHEIIVPAGHDKLVIEDGHWDNLLSRPEFARKCDANRKSYIWDHLIEDFCAHTVNGTAIAASTHSVSETEIGLRIMANESRLNRRSLADAWIDRLGTASKTQISIRTVISTKSIDTAYVFLTVPENLDDENKYRAFRRGYLEKYCFILAWKRSLKRVVGIATEPGLANELRSHDFLVFEPAQWSAEMVHEAQTLQQNLGILYDHKLRVTNVHDDEYPSKPRGQGSSRLRPFAALPNARPERIGRNDRCPCKSGLKYKNCCMRLIQGR